MRYNDILFESTPRTLYHGTLKKFLPAILQIGLMPSVGEFTARMYNDEYEEEIPELVFAADKQGLRRCFSAITSWIRIEYGVRYTIENVKQYGALCVLKQAEHEFERRGDPENDYQDHPIQVETGDYYSSDGIDVSYVMTGNRMLNFFSKYAGIRMEATKVPMKRRSGTE